MDETNSFKIICVHCGTEVAITDDQEENVPIKISVNFAYSLVVECRNCKNKLNL
jgi:hypothetical protein